MWGNPGSFRNWDFPEGPRGGGGGEVGRGGKVEDGMYVLHIAE